MKVEKKLELIKERLIEEIDQLIVQYKKDKTSIDDVNLEEELGQLLWDIIQDVK